MSVNESKSSKGQGAKKSSSRITEVRSREVLFLRSIGMRERRDKRACLFCWYIVEEDRPTLVVKRRSRSACTAPYCFLAGCSLTSLQAIIPSFEDVQQCSLSMNRLALHEQPDLSRHAFAVCVSALPGLPQSPCLLFLALVLVLLLDSCLAFVCLYRMQSWLPLKYRCFNPVFKPVTGLSFQSVSHRRRDNSRL